MCKTTKLVRNISAITIASLIMIGALTCDASVQSIGSGSEAPDTGTTGTAATTLVPGK